MAYDQDLADRIRSLVATQRGLSEKKMFGGLAFLVGGNMAIAASSQGGILVRVDPEQSERLVATTKATVAVMRGRPMAGWLRVDPEHVRTTRQLAKWVDLGTGFAGGLPAKTSKASTGSKPSKASKGSKPSKASKGSRGPKG